jgi:hypothetical protein
MKAALVGSSQAFEVQVCLPLQLSLEGHSNELQGTHEIYVTYMLHSCDRFSRVMLAERRTGSRKLSDRHSPAVTGSVGLSQGHRPQEVNI